MKYFITFIKVHNNIYSDCNELYYLHKDISNKLQEEDSLIKNHSYTLKKCLEYEEEENYLLKKVAKNDFDIDCKNDFDIIYIFYIY